MNLLKGISYLLPNFENFNVMGAVAHGRGVPGALVSAGDAVRGGLWGGGAGRSGGDFLAPEPEMKRSVIIEVALGVLLVSGFAGVWQLQKKIDVQRQALQEERDELVLRSPKLIKRMSLEYAPLVGAMYWTRAVQYYGEKHRLQQIRRGIWNCSGRCWTSRRRWTRI